MKILTNFIQIFCYFLTTHFRSLFVCFSFFLVIINILPLSIIAVDESEPSIIIEQPVVDDVEDDKRSHFYRPASVESGSGLLAGEDLIVDDEGNYGDLHRKILLKSAVNVMMNPELPPPPGDFKRTGLINNNKGGEVDAVLNDELDTTRASQIHSCEFNETTCDWKIYNRDDDDRVYYRVPPFNSTNPPPPYKDGERRLTVIEQQNLWRDYLYVMNTSLFMLTSPDFYLTQIDADRYGHRFHGNVFCASFSAQVSQWTRAGLFMTTDDYKDKKNTIKNVTSSASYKSFGQQRLIWNIDASPDDSWTTYHLNVRFKVGESAFRLQFVATSSLTENLPSVPDGKNRDNGVYFALGFMLLQRGACEQEVLTNDMQVTTKRLESNIDRAQVGDDVRMVVASSAATWPGGIIPYEFAAGYFNSSQKAMIRAAMLDISNRSCIRFVPHLQTGAYVEILGEELGCFSSLGYNGGYSYTNLDATSCWDMRTIRHELLHLVGFYHEHQRPDRDAYVDLLWENIKESTFEQFNIYDESSVELYGYPYDYESIMHYGTKTFSKNGGQTIRPKNPWARIGLIQTYSTYDTLEMRRLYDCDKTNPATPTFGGYCITDAGSFKCQRYAPCEYGIYVCPSPLAHDATTDTCKTSRVIDETCTGANDYCSVKNSKCSSTTGTCQCSTGYYKGPKNDCLVNTANKRLGDACTNVYDCTYEMICDSTSKVCVCPNYQTPVGNYACTNKKLGSSCTTNRECSQAVPSAWCISGTCQCPGAFNTDSYQDENGVIQEACSQKAYTKAVMGAECDLTNGLLCVNSAVCRLCPNSLSDICTTTPQLGLTWNLFPDKPPGFYVIAGSSSYIITPTNNHPQLLLSLLAFIIIILYLTMTVKT